MRYKIVACILLMLPVFSFVLAAPVPVLEVRGAYTNAGDPNEDMIIISRRLAAREWSPYERAYSDSNSYPSASDTEMQASTPQSLSTTNHASGSHSGVDKPSALQKSDSSLYSNIFSNAWSLPGESSNAKKVSWAPATKVHFYDKGDLPGVRPEGLELPPSTVPKTQSSRFGSIFKTIFGKLGKLRFWRRFQRD